MPALPAEKARGNAVTVLAVTVFFVIRFFRDGLAVLLGARMMFFVDAAESLARDVRVNLRGREVAVAEHGLDAARVGSVFEQVRGEAVAKDVRRDAAYARLCRVALEQSPHALPRERATHVAYEESLR